MHISAPHHLHISLCLPSKVTIEPPSTFSHLPPTLSVSMRFCFCFLLSPFTYFSQPPSPAPIWQLSVCALFEWIFNIYYYRNNFKVRNTVPFSEIKLKYTKILLLKYCFPWLVHQWIECQTANLKVAGSIPSQGTCLSCGPGQDPSRGCMRSNHTLMFLSLSPSLLSKNK